MSVKKTVGIISGLAVLMAVGYTQLNTEFDIVLPNGERFNDVVLSNNNYTALQNNVGVMWVGNIDKLSTKPVNSNYCPLALKIWNGHIGYYDKIANDFKDKMLPKYCYVENYGSGMPNWYRVVFKWFEDGLLPEKELMSGIKYLSSI